MNGLARRALLIMLAWTLILAVTGTAQARPAKHFDRGLWDSLLTSSEPGVRSLWQDRARSAGTQIVGLVADWRGIAKGEPARPDDPSDPRYDWEGLDASVRAATAGGFQVVLTINRAPQWAEGPNREASADEGTWRPDPDKLARFSAAVATRFSGSYPDPRNPGSTLPRVRYWQVWAEPNIFAHLNPQRENGRVVGPDHYRRMLNASYAELKRVAASNRVIAAGTAPFGDYGRRGTRVPPLRFWRDVLCLRGKKLKRAKCGGSPARLDILAHNPLSWFAGFFGGPGPWTKGSKLGGPDDLVVPDMRKLQRLLRKARARGTIRPRRRAELWATELLWESRPPESFGPPLSQHANWLADAFYLLWRQGVTAVLWVRLADAPPGTGTLQSGLYFENGSPKPALTAYRFPFVAVRKKGRTNVWGIAPEPGRVRIESRSGGRWRAVKRLKTRRSQVFKGKLPGSAKGRLRAAIGDESSRARKPR